jgi:branched-subunit amino acid transport protein
VIVSARDVIVEGDTRILPVPERVLHLLLFVNLGILITLVGYALLWWHGDETALVRVDYGWASWVLTLMSVGSLAWAVRDGAAARHRGKTIVRA